MIKKKDLSEKDINTWETYLKNPTDLYDKEKNNKKNQERKERFRFDLHGHTLDEANQRVRDIIFSCVKQKYKEILLITGKGLHSSQDDVYKSSQFSKLRYSVPEFINSEPEISKLVLSINTSSKKDGGEGALVVKLRRL